MRFWNKNRKKRSIYAPVSGKAVTLERVGDGVFSEKLVGDGIAVFPSDNKVVVPTDGKVSFIMETGHAFGIRMKEGPEVLVHIGIDTVNERGEGFQVFIQEGQEVKKGMTAVIMDREQLEAKGYNTAVMVLLPEAKSYGTLEERVSGEVEAGKQVVLEL